MFKPPLRLHARQGLVAKLAHGCADRLRGEQGSQHAADPKRRANLTLRTSALAPGIDVLQDVLDEWEVGPRGMISAYPKLILYLSPKSLITPSTY